MKFCDVPQEQYFISNGSVYRKIRKYYEMNAVCISDNRWEPATFGRDASVELCEANGDKIGVPFSEIKIGEYFKDRRHVWLRCIGGVLAFGTVGEPYSGPVICEGNAFTETYFVISKPNWIKFPE